MNISPTSTWSRLACVVSLSLSSLTAFAQEAPTLPQKQVVLPKVTAEVCYTTSVAEVRGLFSRWNNSLQTLDPAKVTANYSDDAVFKDSRRAVVRLPWRWGVRLQFQAAL